MTDEVKPKRKYTRKTKVQDQPEKDLEKEKPKRVYKKKETVKKVKEVVVEDIEDLSLDELRQDRKTTDTPVPEKQQEQNEPSIESPSTESKSETTFYTLNGYDSIEAYIYYEGHKKSVIKYIKDLQKIMDSKLLGSQVIIVGKKFENIGINNCYHSKDLTDKWTDRCLSDKPVSAMRIKDLPRYKPATMFKIITNNKEYSDTVLEVKEY